MMNLQVHRDCCVPLVLLSGHLRTMLFYLLSETYCNLFEKKKFSRGNVVKHHIQAGPFSQGCVDPSGTESAF